MDSLITAQVHGRGRCSPQRTELGSPCLSFDAVKIGLTATPALHTVEILGEPIFTYSEREAVIDGHLVEHEPSIQITTALSGVGIRFCSIEKGSRTR